MLVKWDPGIDRLCYLCKLVDNEVDFLLSCEKYISLREDLDKDVTNKYDCVALLSDHKI